MIIFIVVVSFILILFTIISYFLGYTDLSDYSRRIPQRKQKHFYTITHLAKFINCRFFTIKIKGFFKHREKYRYTNEYEEIEGMSEEYKDEMLDKLKKSLLRD